ncbi:hypothetical protein FXF51_06335 [Nonomuraea sp. PA05]|uniref:DUF6247 family protein n=1 Tax=Nonomuraea sp. PA05 TaxID=2604466 RepID=UPI0011D38011|nr:DUF6247 family protein [Nonomuraea sp. PA05]TYB69779.1 hypothetical protein FXF51_06335 [Nonomuraea sp. PA05]
MTAQPHQQHRTPEEVRASIKDDRSPKALRAAAPVDDHELFDREYAASLDQARVSYDLTPIHDFQTRWWMTAVLKADPDEYRATIEAGERAMSYLARGELPPGAVVVDDAYKARLQEQIDQGK